jgi:enterochelin esterase family protein
MRDDHSPASPRLKALRAVLEAGNTQALESFWKKREEQGTPLIEEADGESDYALVTLLWRDEKAKGVALISLLTSPTTHAMTRLPDTDLWYITCRVRNDIRATYQFFPHDAGQPVHGTSDHSKNWAHYRPDPHNPRVFNFFTEDEDPMGVKLTRSVLEMPDAAPQPWIAWQVGVPQGKVDLHIIRSDILENERSVWVYTPPGYEPDRDDPYGVLVLFDGWAYAKLMPTFTILDNLIATHRIPPLVAVLLDSLDNETRMREMLFCPSLNDFLVRELMPWVKTHYNATSDPRRTVVGGASAGGLAATYAGLEHSEIFGNILSQSGALTIAPPGEEADWLAQQFAERQLLPLRFYAEVGVLEKNSLRELGDRPNLLIGTRQLCDVLKAKGYDVHYVEFGGGHDYISWQGTLSDGLRILTKDC